MIHLFSGDDIKKKLASYEKFVDYLPKGLEVFYINKSNFNASEIESFFSGSGLFFSKCAVILQNVFEDSDIKDFILSKLSFMGDSESLFVFLEGKLKKVELDLFKKARAEINVFELTKAQHEKYNNLLLADAVGDRDKIRLWIYYRQAVDLGVGLEELTGVLFWKMKDMILRKNFNKFNEEELKKISAKLAYLLPEARKESKDAEVVFEKFLLEAF